jgi:hypothetical protein
LLIAATKGFLSIADILREFAKQAAMDYIQVWTAGHMAAIDIDRQRSKIEITQEYAHFQLCQRRRKLLE